jgi:cytochrome c-type biogenesis protein CcmH
MRTQLPAVALGALLALAAMVAVLWLAAPAPTAEARADALAAELRCPDCQGLSVADSQTPAAREIRRQVADLVAGGATDDEVRAHFVDRYGEWILLAPSAPALWLLPLLAVVAGAAVLLAWLRRRSPHTDEASPRASDEARRRVREEAEALDA